MEEEMEPNISELTQLLLRLYQIRKDGLLDEF